MYTLHLNEDELLYLKLLVGKKSGEEKLKLFKETNNLIKDDGINIVASFLLISEFNEREKKSIEIFSNSFYEYKYDQGLYSKIVNAFNNKGEA